MDLNQARLLKDEILIETALKKRGVRSYRIFEKSITVTVSSAPIGQRLPDTLQNRKVFYVIDGVKGKRQRAGRLG
ncbi:MAG: hypothetical protein K2Z81_08875 [Cyanobacteria bacterium]|nr:hypothetical protein [Cyanobacteriota bacterium]